jgi:hypothetical protein
MVKMRSNNLLTVYTEWVATASPSDIELVDAVYLLCEQNYESGGDVIVECYEPDCILSEFKTVEEAKKYYELYEEWHGSLRQDAITAGQ